MASCPMYKAILANNMNMKQHRYNVFARWAISHATAQHVDLAMATVNINIATTNLAKTPTASEEKVVSFAEPSLLKNH